MTTKEQKVLDRIEMWLENAPTHPHIEYLICGDAYGAISGMSPEAVETWNKEAMMSEWKHFIRPDIEAS